MRAAVYTRYGPPEVLQLTEVPTPAPKAKEVLVRIRATPINFGDLLVRNFGAVSPRTFHMPFVFWLVGKAYFGFTAPRINILGSEFAGEIAAVGTGVTRFKAGDQVFGYLGARMGAYAEYLCAPEDGVIARKPSNMTYAEAAAVPYGAVMALNLLTRINLHPGQQVLVNGASGGIGPAAVQLAKRLFRAEVTGVGGTQRLEYIRSLGADRVIDYKKDDFASTGDTYDVIVDVLGKGSIARYRRSLKPNGRCLLISFKEKQLLQMLWTSLVGTKKVICALSHESAKDLHFIRDLIEAGQFTSTIDRCYPLEQAAEAHRYVETGHRKGTVIITMEKQMTC